MRKVISKEKRTEKLWEELLSLDNIDDRIVVIYNDIQKQRPKYKILAKDDPYRFFYLLGGDDSQINAFNWAYEYTYEDFIEQNGLEYSSNDARAWDLEKKSIERAHDLGNWYQTGICILNGPKNMKLEFEFEINEGYRGSISRTPYEKPKNNKKGILIV